MIKCKCFGYPRYFRGKSKRINFNFKSETVAEITCALDGRDTNTKYKTFVKYHDAMQLLVNLSEVRQTTKRIFMILSPHVRAVLSLKETRVQCETLH